MDKNLVPITSVPEIATIVDIRDEINEVKSFYFTFDRPEIEQAFKIRSGQFIMCTVFKEGEFAVSLPLARRMTPSTCPSEELVR